MSFEDKDVKWEPMTDRQALGLVQYALETDGAPLVRRFGAAGAIALVMAIGSRETLWGAVEDKKGDGFGLMQVLPDSHYWNGLNPWDITHHVRAGVRHLVDELNVIPATVPKSFQLLAVALGFNGGLRRAEWLASGGKAGKRPVIENVQYMADVVLNRMPKYLPKGVA